MPDLINIAIRGWSIVSKARWLVESVEFFQTRIWAKASDDKDARTARNHYTFLRHDYSSLQNDDFCSVEAVRAEHVRPRDESANSNVVKMSVSIFQNNASTVVTELQATSDTGKMNHKYHERSSNI